MLFRSGSTPAPALGGPSQGCGEEGTTRSVSAACGSFQNGDCGLGGGMAGSGAGLEPKSGDSGRQGCCRVPHGGHGCHTSWLALGRRAQRDPSAGPGSRAPRLFPPHGRGPGFSGTFKIQISEAPGWLSWLIVRLQLRSISQVVSSSPTSGSVLTAQSLEPASDFGSPSLCVPPVLTLCLSLETISKGLKKKSENYRF